MGRQQPSRAARATTAVQHSGGRKLAVVCVYLAVTLVAVVLGEGVPLVPSLARTFGLGALGAAVLLALPSVTVMLVSIPVGRLSEHFGARRMTVFAAGLLTFSCLAQSVPWLPAVVVGRLACGTSFALVWSAALTWLARLHALSKRGSGHIGATVTCGSIGSAVGPSLAGLLVAAGGMALPFLLTAAAAAGTFVCLLAVGRTGDQPRSGAKAGPMSVAVSWSRRDRRRKRSKAARAAAFSLAMSGAVGGVVQLLVPLALSRHGSSAGAIGIALSVASVVYVLASGVVVRLGARATRLPFNAAMTGLTALALLPALFGSSMWWLESVLVLTSIPRAAIGTLAYPLSVSEIGDSDRRASVFGHLNAVWAAAMMSAPLAAGLLAEHLGIRATYAVALAISTVCSAYLAATVRL